eukprot:TRINITY_DN28545_c0_g1_i1.p1 TRINITY_DN28545_c0_g1~~TRINITY_DN28545_c0_g1_i1.p1  ORF type:complete len:219 (+),score=39.70 TRINITY_DN28545_c0_g1_i1:90-746(+)
MFPNLRLRRLRMTGNLRNLFQEVRLSKNDLVQVVSSNEDGRGMAEAAAKAEIGGIYFEDWKEMQNMSQTNLVKLAELQIDDEENSAVIAAQSGIDIIVVNSADAASRVRSVLDAEKLTNTAIAAILCPESTTEAFTAADFFFVKGGLKTIDLVSSFDDINHRPVATIQATTEYDMLQTAFSNGWLSRDPVIMEYVTAMKRSGARFVATPFALDAAKLI